MAARQKAAQKKSVRKAAAKRELIAPRGDKRYVRRGAKRRIKESDDVGRSLSTDLVARQRVLQRPVRATGATAAGRHFLGQ